MNKFYNDNKNNIFKKYTNEEMICEITKFRNGGKRLNKTINTFFEEIIFEAKGSRGNISPMEALHNDNVISNIIEFVNSKPKFYKGDDITNIKSFFRNAGRTAQKVANFDPNTARDIYSKFTNKGDIIYDYSCGFGTRMGGALLSDRNYFGIDPNTKLFNKLNEYGNLIKDNNLSNSDFDIRCQGSEIFIPEWENKVDFSFSSPPYFNLEVYTNEETQSINNKNYVEWLNEYVRPTIENNYRYLKVGSYFACNIKNLTSGKKYKLFDEWFAIAESIDGFEFVEVIEMKHQSERQYNGKHFTNAEINGFKEPIMIFQKIY